MPLVKTMDVNGINLEYAEYPNGEEAPAVIFLPAMGSTKESFNTMIPSFLKHFQVFSIDHRGHGGSSKQGPYTFEQLVDDIKAFLDGKRLDKVSFITGSFSGAIAQMFAARYPDRVRRLVLLDGGSQ